MPLDMAKNIRFLTPVKKCYFYKES